VRTSERVVNRVCTSVEFAKRTGSFLQFHQKAPPALGRAGPSRHACVRVGPSGPRCPFHFPRN
jgi:hypothetical protein